MIGKIAAEPRHQRIDMYIFQMYNDCMKYEWNPKKNKWLKTNRNISFEQIIFHLGRGDVWRISDYPNQEKYPGQKLYFVPVDGYIYIVPHIIEQDYIFLKIIIPSRKVTRVYRTEKEKKL